MKNRLRIVVLAGISLSLGSIAFDQGRAFMAHCRLDDSDWRRHASDDALRETAQRALRVRIADPHDAFLTLFDKGDCSSIPHLRAALTRMPKGDAVPCTWFHGKQALAKLEQRCGE